MISTGSKTPILVFAVGGRIGSGCSFVRDWLRHSLTTYGYTVEVIDVTKVFLEQVEGFLGSDNTDVIDEESGALPAKARRVRQLQENGNRLRSRLGNEIIAALCVNEVIKPHIEEYNVIKKEVRQAYIIDSLKHPDEVRFLRKVFQDAFCMVGVVASDRVRTKRLRERKGFDDETFKFLSNIDANESNNEHGQRAIDAVTEADYFFANDYATKFEIQREADRLTRLIFGIEVESPRQDEVAMQVAYKESKRSACLSRQVGAAIFDANHRILGVGCNDVPQFGGGLYNAESSQDERCHSRGAKCYNDEEKEIIVTELVDALTQSGLLIGPVDRPKLEKLLRQSRIKNLIEFSRAVHAEMDSILNVARAGHSGLVGSTLFCTTFPCHNCAKHIIDAGITRVVYLEPYEKSLARKLHSDAINDPDEERRDDKVSFDLYGGVAPRRFGRFFGMQEDKPRKDRGRFVDQDRWREGLFPIAAPEAETIWSRVQRVAMEIELHVERVGMDTGTDSELASPPTCPVELSNPKAVKSASSEPERDVSDGP